MHKSYTIATSDITGFYQNQTLISKPDTLIDGLISSSWKNFRKVYSSQLYVHSPETGYIRVSNIVIPKEASVVSTLKKLFLKIN